LTNSGKLRALLFRIPEVTIHITPESGRQSTFRVLPDVLGAPMPATYLPSDLKQFADVFRLDQPPAFAVQQLMLGGPGISAYQQPCDVEWIRIPANTAPSS
jgi:hypothetical protein